MQFFALAKMKFAAILIHIFNHVIGIGILASVFINLWNETIPNAYTSVSPLVVFSNGGRRVVVVTSTRFFGLGGWREDEEVTRQRLILFIFRLGFSCCCAEAKVIMHSTAGINILHFCLIVVLMLLESKGKKWERVGFSRCVSRGQKGEQVLFSKTREW